MDKSEEVTQALVAAAETVPAASLATPEEAPRYTIEVLSCPKCGAPATLEAVQDLTKPIQCPFCDAVYSIHQSQDNAQHLKQELKAWLDQMIVGSGYGGTGNVDINARRYIFSESLYPTLKRDIDRRLEAFENVLGAPLVQIEATKDFHEQRPDERLMAIANGSNQWLKTLSTRTLAQQLQDFAVVPGDKQRLYQLQLRVLSLIYYANIAQQQHSRNQISYHVVRQNLVALQKDYQSYAQKLEDPIYLSYIQALDARISGDILFLDLLISALEEGQAITPESQLNQLNAVLARLDKASQLALASTYNPFYVSSLSDGIQKDRTIVGIVRAVADCFEVVTRTRANEFKSFYHQLLQYVQSLTQVQSAEHLLWLLTSIRRVLEARAGDRDKLLPVVKDWSWLERSVEAGRQKAAFGAGETAQVLRQHYHPYWIAQFSYSTLEGMLVKKASVHNGFLLIDATVSEVYVVTPVLEADAPRIGVGLHNFQLLDKQIPSLPAIITLDMAERAMKSYVHIHEAELKILATCMLGVIYLPAASVCYTTKNKQRTVILGYLEGINQQLEQALKQTQAFLWEQG